MHARAVKHVESAKPVVPFSVGLELLFVARRFDLTCVDAVGAAEGHFAVAGRGVLFTAAEAVDAGEVKTVFDAVYLAGALHRGGALHTADIELLSNPFPTRSF